MKREKKVDVRKERKSYYHQDIERAWKKVSYGTKRGEQVLASRSVRERKERGKKPL